MAKAKFVACTVFCGTEDYLLDREKQRAMAWPGRLATVLDGAEASEEGVVSALSQSTFDGSGTVVVLDNAEKVKLGKALIAFLEERDPQDTSSVLVAILRKDALPKGWSKVVEKGRLISHQKCKPWDTAAIERRVQAEAKLLNIQVAPEAFQVLHKVYADNIRGMVNELTKLTFLVGKGGVVSKDDVLSVCSRQIPVMPWDVSEAAAKKSIKQALTLAGLLFKYEGDNAAIAIVASLMKQVEKMTLARSLLDRGCSAETISQALDMNKFILEKKLLPLVRRHTLPSLITQMKTLCDLEPQVKGSALSKRTLVELAILSIAA